MSDKGLCEPGDADLAAHGWAPGGYMMRCHDCGATESFGAKRRLRCRACAAALWMAAQAGGEGAVPVTTPRRRDVIAAALCDAMNAPGAWDALGAEARTVWLHRGDGLVRALAAREWVCEPIAGIEWLEAAVPAGHAVGVTHADGSAS